MKLGIALPIVDNESGHPHRIAGIRWRITSRR